MILTNNYSNLKKKKKKKDSQKTMSDYYAVEKTKIIRE